ncbi:ABC transporter permease [Thermococcus barophilus]|nr:ABC transporter permease subunit [Thermococcus barophilus]
MNPILNVAAKDVYEGIKTKRFIITLAVFVLAGMGMAYWTKSVLMNMQIEGVNTVNILRGSQISSVKYFLAILGMLIGADAINRETEEGTIKVTLSHPIYRDQFILGKFLGRAATLTVAFLLFAVASLASMLVVGIPPNMELLMTFVKPLPFFLLFSLVYLALGMLLSVLIKKPATAIIVAIILPIFIEFLYPTVVSIVVVIEAMHSSGLSQAALQDAISKVNLFLSVVPGYHLQNITNAIFYGVTSSQMTQGGVGMALSESYTAPPYFEALSLAWKNIVILAVMLLLPFAFMYVKFMRTDLR